VSVGALADVVLGCRDRDMSRTTIEVIIFPVDCPMVFITQSSFTVAPTMDEKNANFSVS
jgi:hypothetical protein